MIIVFLGHDMPQIDALRLILLRLFSKNQCISTFVNINSPDLVTLHLKNTDASLDQISKCIHKRLKGFY